VLDPDGTQEKLTSRRVAADETTRVTGVVAGCNTNPSVNPPTPVTITTAARKASRRVILPPRLRTVTALLNRSALQHPLERSNPAAELVLRGHENHEVRRAPLQELAAKLLQAFSEDLLVPHVDARILPRVIPSVGEVGEITSTSWSSTSSRLVLSPRTLGGRVRR